MSSSFTTKGQKYNFCSGHRFLKCSPELYFEPENITEIRQILAAACVNQKHVKVIGSPQSLSPLNVTDGYMICLRKMSRAIQVDFSMKTVHAEAGLKLSELNRILNENGMTLSVLPWDTDSTLGGAISCGDVGLGEGHTNLSDCVLEMEVVTAVGDVITMSHARDEALMKAACLSLGALGVITKVKLQCEPITKIRWVTHGLKLGQVLETLPVHQAASDDFSFDWYPHTENVVISHAKAANWSSKKYSSSLSWFWDVLVGYHLLRLLLWIRNLTSSYYPPIVSWVEDLFYKMRHKRQEYTQNPFVKKQHQLHGRDTIWFIPKDKTGLVLFEIQDWIMKNNFPAHFPIAVRFSEPDDKLLSHSFMMASSCIKIPTSWIYGRPVSDQTRLMLAVRQIALNAGGRLHWSNVDENTFPFDEVHQMYPGLETFILIRRKLDPNGRFLNTFLRTIFGIE